MDMEILLQEETKLKHYLVKMTEKLDELYEIKDKTKIDLRIYCYDSGHPLEGLLFTEEYDRLMCILQKAQEDILIYEKLEDKIETRYLKLSTKLRKSGY